MQLILDYIGRWRHLASDGINASGVSMFQGEEETCLQHFLSPVRHYKCQINSMSWYHVMYASSVCMHVHVGACMECVVCIMWCM